MVDVPSSTSNGQTGEPSGGTMVKLTRKDFQTKNDVRWCPGCGDYAILATLQRFLPDIGVDKEKIVFVSGIGCSSRFPYYMETYGVHSIHGRAPTIATGVKLANPELDVWVISGDGDSLSIGGNHLLHVLRRNLNLTILLFNNRIYGLTKGQYSPASEQGKVTKSSPLGSLDYPVNPASFALGAGATFYARTTDVDVKHMLEVLKAAHEHQGTSLVEIMQNCPVFNDGAFKGFTDKKQKNANTVLLQDGKPLLFNNDTRGIGLDRDTLEPVVIDLEAEPSRMSEVLVHNSKNASTLTASLYAEMQAPEFPMPLGVFRQEDRATYESLLDSQLAHAQEKNTNTDVRKMLFAGDMWTVD
jgi:2-oxoglutarate/2-oxoacid ferredoxin oxidoreductase subunit beta